MRRLHWMTSLIGSARETRVLLIYLKSMSTTTNGNLECIREYCTGSETSIIPKNLARDIVSGKTHLLAIVEALGIVEDREFLASSVVGERCQGTKLLSEVLGQLSSHQLPPEDVHYLVEFYCDRLKDKVAVLPFVLRGLHAMIVHQRVSADKDVVTIARGIFSQVYNQSLPQGERRLVYIIMDFILSDHIQAVKEIGSDFVLGYIQAMDGEKDPRNLVIVLNSVYRIILNLPFDTLAEDLFEVVACYFPIDFTPPPNDPHAISKEELVSSLRKCLTSTPKFTKFSLPLLLEKVSSDLLSAKLDSLLTIAAGCHTFDVTILYTHHLQSLWTAIRTEMFQSVSEEVERAGCQCLEGLSRALGERGTGGAGGGEGGGGGGGGGGGRGGGGGGKELGEFTEMVLTDCNRNLLDPELKFLKPTALILESVARGCAAASHIITSASLPHLIQQFNSRSAVSQKKSLLQVLVEFIKILGIFHSNNAGSNPLKDQKEDIISLVVLCVRGGREELVEVGLDVCRGLLVLRGLLELKEIVMLAEHVKQLALSRRERLTVPRDRVCDVLRCLAENYPEIVLEDILPTLLLSFIPPAQEDAMETNNSDSSSSSTSESMSLLPDLSRVLVSLSSTVKLQEQTLPAFMVVLERLAKSKSLCSDHVVVATSVTGHLCKLVEKVVRGDDVGVQLVHTRVARSIIHQCILPTLTNGLVSTTSSIFTEDTVIKECLFLLRTFTLAANNSPTVSGEWATLIRETFLDGKGSLVPSESTFCPLEPASPPTQTRLSGILVSTVGVMTREMVRSQASVYLPRLLEQAMHCSDTVSSHHCSLCHASIMNKICNDSEEDFKQLVTSTMSKLWPAIMEGKSTTEARGRSLTTWLWLTKALVMCSHPTGKTMTYRLLDLLSDPDVRSCVADGFSVILGDSEVLSTKTHCISRLMHKQQFCQEVVPELVGRFNTTSTGEGEYILRTLSHILLCVPKQVLLEHLPLLHPLLLESLNTEDVGLSQSTLDGLHAILQNPASAPVMTDNLSSLVPRLLSLSIRPDSMKIRCSALLCLSELSKLPRHLVVSYQNQVLCGLVTCLDDKKRLVRKEAVRTRSKWFMLDTA